MTTPTNLYYADSHEWVLVENGIGTVGISDHAQQELTDIVYAEPPAPGKMVTAGETAAVVESVKAASDIYSPVSGEILESNPALEAEPALLNTDPLGAGWIYKIRLSDPSELDGLKSAEDYLSFIG